MPAMGERAPARILVAVRAMAPVAGNAAEQGRDNVGNALRDELDVGVVAVAASCRRQTTAENRLSRRRSMATVNAGRASRG